jgi:EAL domain
VLCNTWLVTNPRSEPLHLDGHGRPRHVVRQLVDLREGRHPEDQLVWRATHDALTGLPNRSLFLDRLESTLARLGRESTVAAGRLCLEVTEQALSANRASAATTLKRLSALGVRVSVDDFGTGYSSLSSSTCRCRRSRSTARSWPASTSTPPTTPWWRPSSASATPSATTAAGSRVPAEPIRRPWCMRGRDRVRGGPTTGRTGTRRAGTRGRCARL